MKFSSTNTYIATDELQMAVNAAVTLERPLLIKGEPGTGKTMLAEEVAKSLDMPIISWNIKSTTKAQQGLYEYDAVSRLRDSQLGDDRVHDIRNYIEKGKLWEAFEADQKVVLLIDEIDKADIEFPNDLLQELDKMEFFVYETGEMVKAKIRPIVILPQITRKNCLTLFCVAASFTTLTSLTVKPCRKSLMCITQRSSKTWLKKRSRFSLMFVRCLVSRRSRLLLS